MNILVTGRTGYIGSHTVIELLSALLSAGHSVVVVDNLSNSSPISLERVETITGETVPFYKVDIRDREALEAVFAEHPFDYWISVPWKRMRKQNRSSVCRMYRRTVPMG